MADRIWACVKAGRVVNNIVASQSFVDFVRSDYDEIVEVTDTWTSRDGMTPSAGWLRVNGAFVAPPSLKASGDSTVTADGTSMVTVTYADATPSAPASVTFDVNGATTSVALANGKAELDITASTPGPIVVTAQGLSTTITAKGA